MTGTQTPRAKLEDEVRITARKQKPAIIEVEGGGELAGKILPVPFESLEEILAEIGQLVARLFKMGAILQGKGEKLSLAGSDTGESTEVSTPEVAGSASVDSPEIGFEDLLDPEVFTSVGLKARDIIKSILGVGTTFNWEDLKKLDWLVPISLALEVIKYNVGPEVKAFLSEETKSLKEALLPTHRTSTEPGPS